MRVFIESNPLFNIPGRETVIVTICTQVITETLIHLYVMTNFSFFVSLDKSTGP